MAINIQDANISVRTYNCLKRAGYTTLEEVAEAGEERIKMIRNLGATCLDELKAVLPSYGLAFAEPEYIAPPYLRSIPKGFIKLTTNDDRPIVIRADMIESFVRGGGRAEGNTVIFTPSCPDDDGSYWVKETFEEVCRLIELERR